MQVFTTAASDEQPTIVRLAFDTIEKIVREHFHYITETETTTFTDCVNCLIAFTNNPHSIDVSLNAIAFLRFCAMKLAEGDIGVPLASRAYKSNTQPVCHRLTARQYELATFSFVPPAVRARGIRGFSCSCTLCLKASPSPYNPQLVLRWHVALAAH